MARDLIDRRMARCVSCHRWASVTVTPDGNDNHECGHCKGYMSVLTRSEWRRHLAGLPFASADEIAEREKKEALLGGLRIEPAGTSHDTGPETVAPLVAKETPP